jgi:tetratricopeptide (TPR) repeat protein
MKKYFLTAAFCTVYWLFSFSQISEALRMDSIKLDSSKKEVRLLKGAAKVDMLNQIALRTGYITSKQRRIAISYSYATEALNEATEIRYKPGIALASLILSASSNDSTMNMPGKDEATKENDIRKAIRIGEETNYNKVMGWGYYYLADMPSVKNDFAKHVEYYKKAIDNFLKIQDTLHAAEITNWLCSDYASRGEYEQAFDYGRKSVLLSKKSGTDFSMDWQQFLVQYSLAGMYDLYTVAGDYNEAMNYLLEMDQYGKEHQGAGWDMPMLTADLFCKVGKYDSARIYIDRWVKNGAGIGTGKGHQAAAWAILGKIYLNSKEYDKAIEIFKNWSDTIKKYHPLGLYATTSYLISIAKGYSEKKNYTIALKYAKKGVSLSEEKSERPIMMQGYQVLSSVYHGLGNNDSAYKYLQKYMMIKDSLQSKQFLLRSYNSKKEAEEEMKKAQLGFLMKDNKIKQEQLKQEAMLKNFLIIFLLVLFIAGIFIFRNLNLKRKNEKLKGATQQAELQEKAIRLEMQALRAQMNPHFIFNCLSSINCFILVNDTEKASDYLTRFSRLIRMVLNNSEKSLITLEEELKMLGLYLDMERLRFENSFDYNITYTNDVDAASVLIPPLLLQPFCENAIWHGLMHKDGHGHLNINILKEKEFLNCIITDDGVGKAKAEALNSLSIKKEKSMGLKITAERLSLFNGEREMDHFYEMDDLVNENGSIMGTKVSVKIRHRHLMEAVA